MLSTSEFLDRCDLIDALFNIWTEEYSDLRFWQFLQMLEERLDEWTATDLFYLEDSQFMDFLDAVYP